MSLTKLVPLLLAVCCLGGMPESARAADAAAAPASTPADQSALHAQAEKAADAGRKALQLYRKDQTANPNAVVDAALAFADAHKLYQQVHDDDAVAEMQANIFWCKKQMNLDAVNQYLAREGKTGAMAQVDAVADRKIETSEAQAYFDRAKKYATDHKDDLNGISIRYYEVAERFLGTQISLDAQKLSLDAQSRYAKWLQSGGALRETRFSKATQVKAGSKVAIPDERTVKATITDLKKIYAKDYARKTESQKRHFAAKLVEEAEKSRSDATSYYCTLIEAVRLAQESEDYERLLDTIDVMSGAFEGFSASEQKKFWLKKLTGKPTAAAIVTLLDNPDDAGANTAAGKFFAFQLKRWDQGLPMLSNGNDADLKAVAEQELANPQDDSQRVQVADSWFALTKKGGSTADKNAFLARSQHWYQLARGLNGVAKTRVAQRLDEIDRALPLDMDNIDWASLTPSQWSKLKGQEVLVQVRVDRMGPVASLKPGQQMRVVPNPADSWTCQSWNGLVTTTWSGIDEIRQRDSTILLATSFSVPYSSFRFGELLVAVDKAAPQSCGVINGPGPVWIMPNRPSGDNKGQIRVKLLSVDDE